MSLDLQPDADLNGAAGPVDAAALAAKRDRTWLVPAMGNAWFPVKIVNDVALPGASGSGASGSDLKIRNRLGAVGRLSGVESLRPQDPDWSDDLWFSNEYRYVPVTDRSSEIEGCATVFRAFAIRLRGWRENAKTQRR